MECYKAKKDIYNEVNLFSGDCRYLIPKDSTWMVVGRQKGFKTLLNTDHSDLVLLSVESIEENFDSL